MQQNGFQRRKTIRRQLHNEGRSFALKHGFVQNNAGEHGHENAQAVNAEGDQSLIGSEECAGEYGIHGNPGAA
ncbi:hypothetical protein D3C72_2366960 [compost metagenome]